MKEAGPQSHESGALRAAPRRRPGFQVGSQRPGGGEIPSQTQTRHGLCFFDTILCYFDNLHSKCRIFHVHQSEPATIFVKPTCILEEDLVDHQNAER